MSKHHEANIESLESLRKRLTEGALSKGDIATLDQMVVGHIELQKSLATSGEKIGDKTVIAKLPFGVDLVK